MFAGYLLQLEVLDYFLIKNIYCNIYLTVILAVKIVTCDFVRETVMVPNLISNKCIEIPYGNINGNNRLYSRGSSFFKIKMDLRKEY